MPVRLKRNIEDETFKNFVLNSKKRKLSDPDQNKIEATTIHRFSSVLSQDDKIESKITRLKSKEDAKERMSKIRNPDIILRNRQKNVIKSHSNRCLVTNCYRTTEIEDEEKFLEIKFESKTSARRKSSRYRSY